MRQITYNSSSNVLRFEFPLEWKGDDVSAITIAIKDKNGNELLSAQSVTLYTATELDGAVAAYLDEITLDSGAGNLAPGDPLLIDGVAGPEFHRVKGYDTTTKVVTLEETLDHAHEDADAVYGLWGTYTLDTTTVATWTAGLVVTLIWTPTGSGQPTTELAQISKSVVDIEGILLRFSRIYPRAYKSFTEPENRIEDILDEAELQVKHELLARNMDYDRIVDQDIISTVVMAKMAWLWCFQGDEPMKDEREAMSAEYSRQFELVAQLPIWIDQDQDNIEDEDEVTDHSHIFRRAW